MKSYQNYLLSKGQSKETIKTNYTQLCHYLNWCDDEKLEAEESTYGDILAYIKHLQKRELKQRTIQLYVNSLKHYFSWLQKINRITESPVSSIDIKGIKRKQLHHVLSIQELESLYNNFQIQEEGKPKQVLSNKRDKVMLGMMIWQGLGTTELKTLREEDVKLREGKLHIARGRRYNERTLRLEPQQIMDLMDYVMYTRKELLELREQESERLFLSTGKGDRVNSLIEFLMQKLKRQNSSVHSVKQIRTSVITSWLKHYNLREVQYRAGHRNIGSTEAYQINDLEDLKTDVNKYHPI